MYGLTCYVLLGTDSLNNCVCLIQCDNCKVRPPWDWYTIFSCSMQQRQAEAVPHSTLALMGPTAQIRDSPVHIVFFNGRFAVAKAPEL